MRWPRLQLRPGALPLLPLAPAVVLVVGVAVAVSMGVLGLVQLRRTSDDGASDQAQALARVVATRVRIVPAEDREETIAQAARRTGADLLLVNQQGVVLTDTIVGHRPSVAPLDMLIARDGFTDTSTGRTAFAVQELEAPFAHLVLIVLVHAPANPAGTRPLISAVVLLATLLIGGAAAVAFVFSKNARDDVEFVRRRISGLARDQSEGVGGQIPVRTFDQVGVLTAAFDALLERFAAAERAYRHDLEQADALDRARARFLATLSHELRTPLHAILGFADVLLSEVDGPLGPSAREDLEVIRSSGEHLRALIDDVLDLSAIELGSLRLERRAVDVTEIAEQVVRESLPALAGRDLGVRLEGERGAVAHADPQRVRQILANLVGNAVKFTARGEVTVRVARREGRVILEVSDTGPGIAEGDVAALFQEYRQVGDTASRRKGTGLGLAIAKRLTSMHDGTISVRSQLGRGSTFVVDLPGAP
jgi:signal transduction histidine kinase